MNTSTPESKAAEDPSACGWLLLLAHRRSPPLTAGSPPLTAAHRCSLLLTTAHHCSLLFTTAHYCAQIGLLDLEINRCSKMLCGFLLLMTSVLVTAKGFDNSNWWLLGVRFMLLFSSIIPISLRINLDMAKTYYSFLIARDPVTVVNNLPNRLTARPLRKSQKPSYGTRMCLKNSAG